MNTTRYHLSEKELRYIGKRMPKGYSLVCGQMQDGSTQPDRGGLNDKKRVSRLTSGLEERWSNTAAGIVNTIMHSECMKLLSEEINRQQSVDGSKSSKCGVLGLDLASVKRKLMIGDYIGQTAFLRDMDTVWHAGSRFPPDSKARKLCQALHDIFDQMYFKGKDATDIHNMSAQFIKNLLKQELKSAKRKTLRSNGEPPKNVDKSRHNRPKPATAAPAAQFQNTVQSEALAQSEQIPKKAAARFVRDSRKKSESRKKEVAVIPVKPATGKQKFEASKQYRNQRHAGQAPKNGADLAAPSKRLQAAEGGDVRSLLQQELSDFVKDAKEEEIGSLIDIYRRHIDDEAAERELEIRVLEIPDSAVEDLRGFITQRKQNSDNRHDGFNQGCAGFDVLYGTPENGMLEVKDCLRDPLRASRDRADSNRSSFFTGTLCSPDSESEG